MKTKERTFVTLLALGALLLGGAYVARTTNTERGRERVVVFRAEWRPMNIRALVAEYGVGGGATDVSTNVTTPVRKTRRVASGEIAVLDVELPGRFDTFNFTCSIQVEREAPKITVSDGKRCRVEKYVS